MTLLITVLAAVASTLIWYLTVEKQDLKLDVLVFLYWGASIMWLVDAFFEYAELGADYFAPAADDMLNDTFLGLSVVALGLVVWIVRLLLADPRGVIARRLSGKSATHRDTVKGA